MGGSKGPDNKSRVLALVLHIDNTREVINEYQSKVKSSNLRSYSASLNTILSDTSNKLNNYATEILKAQSKDLSEKTTEEENLIKDELINTLFEAKITGRLDRTYAYEMAQEISSIAERESQILKSTSKDDLKAILESSYNSLSVLYDEFDNYLQSK